MAPSPSKSATARLPDLDADRARTVGRYDVIDKLVADALAGPVMVVVVDVLAQGPRKMPVTKWRDAGGQIAAG